MTTKKQELAAIDAELETALQAVRDGYQGRKDRIELEHAVRDATGCSHAFRVIEQMEHTTFQHRWKDQDGENLKQREVDVDAVVLWVEGLHA